MHDYFSKMFTVDMLVLNEDRHFNNIALIFDGEYYRPAPLFDHGISLLTANLSVIRRLELSENVKRVVARPFSGSFKKMRDYFGVGVGFDQKEALNWLKTEPDSFEKGVLEYQLMHMDD